MSVRDTSHPTPARSADLTGTVCPMTVVQFGLHIRRVTPDEVLEVILKAGEQMRELPKSIKEEGHRIEAVRQDGDRYHLFVRRGA